MCGVTHMYFTPPSLSPLPTVIIVILTYPASVHDKQGGWYSTRR